jgi:hypothetical protein
VSQLDRREFARSLAIFAAAPLLTRCAQVESANWQAAIQSIGSDWAAVAPELSELGVNVSTTINLPGGGTTTVSGLTSLVQNATSAITSVSTETEGQSVLVKVEAYVNVLVPIIWPIVQPMITAANPGVGLTLGLIVADLPAIEGLLNFATQLTEDALQLAKLAPAPASARYHRRLV